MAGNTVDNLSEFTIEDLVGTYKFVKDDGRFDDFLKESRVGLIPRKLAATAAPNIEITIEEDGTIVLKILSIIKSQTLKFRLGEEFIEKRLDGIEVKTIFTREGNKLIQNSTSDEVPPTTVEREFINNRLIATCRINDVVCVREYKRV